MSEVKKKCKYESKWTGWECSYEALEDSKEGFCIFHDRRKDKNIEKFNEGIKNILEDKDSDAYHFEGFYFSGDIFFQSKEFKKDVHFEDAEFCGKITVFVSIRFSGNKTMFWYAKFLGGWTSFSDVKFVGKNTGFGLAQFSRGNSNFTDVTFSGENTVLSGSEFSGENINFNDVRFSGKNVRFSQAEFRGRNTVFSKAKFLAENIDFTGVKFIGERALFDDCTFGGKMDFSNSIFQANTIFSKVDLRKCILKGVDLKNIDFSLMNWNWKDKLGDEVLLEETLRQINSEEERYFRRKRKNENYTRVGETYRQLKVQFHNKRDFAKAGMFHFREQECKRKACKLPKDFSKWAFLRILKWSCGYGEKLWKVGVGSAELIIASAITYMWWFGLYTNDQNESLVFQYRIAFKNTAPIWTIIKDFFTSLSFSIKGFFPLWRFQQYKVVGEFANLVAGIEFLLGAFMVGLFVYVFRRRMEK